MIGPAPPAAPGAPGPRRRGPGGCWWVAGCFLLFVVVAFTGTGLVLWSLFQGVQSSAPCLPSDFPTYPSSVWAGSSVAFPECRIGQATFDDANRVMDWYKGNLKGRIWTIDSIDRNIHRIDFSNVRATIKGIVFFVDRVVFKVICVDFYHQATAEPLPQLRMESIALRPRGWVCDGNPPQAPIPA
jgi:hypothetical protein